MSVLPLPDTALEQDGEAGFTGAEAILFYS